MDDRPDETQIHIIEHEAYSSVLCAFKAQSDHAITWKKESLITELRKELRVSDEEHRELLSRVNADEMTRPIRNSLQSVFSQLDIGGKSKEDVSLPKGTYDDMETQIHLIAYSSILCAFKAQSDDAITWKKESLITELRKELWVSDEEHRELLSRVNADEMIRPIREWRKGNSLRSGVSQPDIVGKSKEDTSLPKGAETSFGTTGFGKMKLPRKWNKEETITLLERLVAWRAQTGVPPKKGADWVSIYGFIGGSIAKKFDKEQVASKIRKLEESFEKKKINQGTEEFRLSQMIWGEHGGQ